MRADIQGPVALEPGEYGKFPVGIGKDSFEAWWYCTPNGLLGRLSMPEDVAAGRAPGAHHVEEHEDGEISVLPQPGNSNSILVEGWPHRGPDAGRLRTEGEPLMRWHG